MAWADRLSTTERLVAASDLRTAMLSSRPPPPSLTRSQRRESGLRDKGDGSSDHGAGEGRAGRSRRSWTSSPTRTGSGLPSKRYCSLSTRRLVPRCWPRSSGGRCRRWRAALHSLRDEYDAGARGFDLREVADGWRLYSRDEFAGYVERFVLDGQRARLTQAALETLAVIAYRQPVTRSRISAIRGVSVDAVMRTLLTRGLVEECGADPDTGGGLYRTTSLFLEKMGLRSLDELPSLAPLLPDTSQLDDVELST